MSDHAAHSSYRTVIGPTTPYRSPIPAVTEDGRDQRNRGHAQALMVDSFAQGRAHGATTSALLTDSRTGALGLYEKVGMRVTSVWVHRAITF